MAAPSSPAIWALWPQACAAPVSGSATGCPATTRPSSSPSSAKVGPSFAPAASARTPVSARPLLGFRPSSLRVSSDEPRGLELLEAELGLPADALAQADDALRVAVDGAADRILELFLSRHWSFTPRCGLASSPLPGLIGAWWRPCRGYCAKRWGKNGVIDAGVSPSTMQRVSSAAVMGAMRMPLR